MDINFKNYMERKKKLMNEYEDNKFKEWLLSSNEGSISNMKKVYDIYYSILDILKHNNYQVINENQFKDELATYIYRNSQRQCPNEI